MNATWDVFKSLGLATQIGVIVAVLAAAAGLVPVYMASVIAGVVVTLLVVAVVAGILWGSYGSEVRRRRLQRSGVPAEATILAVRESGMTIQSNYPIAKIRFEVHPPGGAPYETTARCLINRFEIPAYQPGVTVPVLIDPRNRTRVTLA